MPLKYIQLNSVSKKEPTRAFDTTMSTAEEETHISKAVSSTPNSRENQQTQNSVVDGTTPPKEQVVDSSACDGVVGKSAGVGPLTKRKFQDVFLPPRAYENSDPTNLYGIAKLSVSGKDVLITATSKQVLFLDQSSLKRRSPHPLQLKGLPENGEIIAVDAFNQTNERGDCGAPVVVVAVCQVRSCPSYASFFVNAFVLLFMFPSHCFVDSLMFVSLKRCSFF